MTIYTHALNIGSIRCTVIADGVNEVDDDHVLRLYGKMPEEDVRAALKTVTRPMMNAFNCLLIQSGDQNLLIDTGMGPAYPAGIGGGIVAGLDALNIQPDAIDTVFISHFHGDHVNGLVHKDGSPVYPNARYLSNRLEWEAWHGDAIKERFGETWAEAMAPVMAIQDRLTTIEVGDDLLPGVTTIPIYGHTPGHTGLRIESDGDTLLCLVDGLLRQIQLPYPDWKPLFDHAPEEAVKTRRELLGKAADENLLTLLYHFPFPGLGHLKRDGDGFTWHPVA